MHNNVLEVENLSKLYRLGEVGTGTLSHDLNRWWSKIRGKEDPFAKVGSVNNRSEKASKGEYVWALKDTSFEVEKGDVLGVIGKNGAGKSTLLKLISRITKPTHGEIRAKGRIASLLEVGTGFHPEMTGRENIFLNGAILGMTKQEIRSKLDSIVEFSGVAKYVDTPVKRYSSGMIVRLAFAVAAYLEPEILVVDEVLAVGDADFQKKAIGKMQDVAQGYGRTVLFVSHNMGAVRTLCNKGLLLKDGRLAYKGDVSEAIERYSNNVNTTEREVGIITKEDYSAFTGEANFKKVFLLDQSGNITDEVYYRSPLNLKMTLDVNEKVKNPLIDIRVISKEGIELIHAMNGYSEEGKLEEIESGLYELNVLVENKLQPGRYSLTIGIHYSNGYTINYVENIYDFSVLSAAKIDKESYPYNWIAGYMHSSSQWQIKEVIES